MICPICQHDLGNTWPEFCPKCGCALRKDRDVYDKRRKSLILVTLAIAVLLISVLAVYDKETDDKQVLSQYGNIVCDGDFSEGKLRFMSDDNGSLTLYLDAKYREDTIFYKWIIYDIDNDVKLVEDTKTITYYEWKNPSYGHYRVILRIGATAVDMLEFSGTITLK